VGVNGQSLGEFLEVLILSILAANADANLHEYALTAPPGARVDRCIRYLSHATSLKINYTRQDGIVERIAGGCMQTGYPGFLAALVDRNVMTRVAAKIDLARACNFLFGVEKHLLPLSDPSGSARNREEHWEHGHRKTH
jgi:hypothetical protein